MSLDKMKEAVDVANSDSREHDWQTAKSAAVAFRHKRRKASGSSELEWTEEHCGFDEQEKLNILGTLHEIGIGILERTEWEVDE